MNTLIKRPHMPFAALFGALSCTLLLAGCTTVGPDYKTPASTMLPAYHGEAALAARGAALPAPALDSWWKGFDDPALTRIVDRALAENLNIAAALARALQARAAAREAGARELPEGSFSTDVTRQRQSLQSPLGAIGSHLPGFERNVTLYDIGAGASWELDLAGGLKRGTESAQAQAQAAEAERMGVRITVAAEAADAYFRVRGAQRRIALAQEQIANNGRLLELVRLRLADGLASRGELAQAEALLAQSRAVVPPLRIERDVQLNRLDVLMGAQPGTYAAELAAPAPDTRVPAISVAQGPADLLRRRPDVIAAERRVAATNANIGVATAEYYPHASLSALLGFTSLGSAGLVSGASFQPQVGAGLRWRLFDFGRVDAEVAQAKGANAEALALYRKSMLRASEDVENAVVTLAELEAQHAELARQVDAQTQARDAADEAYKGGAVSLYEVLEENRLLLAARDEQARVHADNARAAVSTFRALGGGW